MIASCFLLNLSIKLRSTPEQSEWSATTYYASSSYVVEVDGSDTTVRKTYTAGYTSLAVRTIVNGSTETLNWLLSDHLGSSSITTTADGTWNSEIRYSAFGETRYSLGITPTDYRYTGQLEQADVNLYYYNARYYDAALGRFIQADTIIPGAGNSKSYDRYAYVNNNPIRYTDPSGHAIVKEDDPGTGKPIIDVKNTPSISIYSSYTSTSPTPPSSPSLIDIINSTKSTPSSVSINSSNNTGSGYPDDPNPDAPKVSLGTSPNELCNENNLVWCFYQRGLLPTGTYYVTRDQIDEIMLAVFYDIEQRSIFGWFDRRIYDTPLWDGAGLAVSTICVDEVDNCYTGVEINYFAQGMWSAKFEGYENGIKLVENWKDSQYGEEPSAGTIYWFTEGYNYWIDHSNKNE